MIPDIFNDGDIQRVGYRGVVERVARKMKLTGFVENIKPYDVKIVCEGEKINIDAFIRSIKITDYPIGEGNIISLCLGVSVAFQDHYLPSPMPYVKYSS